MLWLMKIHKQAFSSQVCCRYFATLEFTPHHVYFLFLAYLYFYESCIHSVVVIDVFMQFL